MGKNLIQSNIFDTHWFEECNHVITDCYFHDPDYDNLSLERRYFDLLNDLRRLQYNYTSMLFQLSDLEDYELPFKE